MVTKEMVDRINELARKQRSVGLDEAEKTEQAELRQKYVASFRANLKAQLDNIKVVTPEEYERIMAERAKEEHHCHEDGCSCGHHKKDDLH